MQVGRALTEASGLFFFPPPFVAAPFVWIVLPFLVLKMYFMYLF